MTNLEKYNMVFMGVMKKKENELAELKYQNIPEWDSFGHMNLISELEEAFEIMLSTPDVLSFNSYISGKDVLKKYGVIIEN